MRRIDLRALAFAALLVALPHPASAVEIRDAEIVSGGSSLLQNTGGTVRLEDPRLGRLAPPRVVPEPAGAAQIGAGIVILAALERRRRARQERTDHRRTPRC